MNATIITRIVAWWVIWWVGEEIKFGMEFYIPYSMIFNKYWFNLDCTENVNFIWFCHLWRRIKKYFWKWKQFISSIYFGLQRDFLWNTSR